MDPEHSQHGDMPSVFIRLGSLPSIINYLHDNHQR